MPCNKKGSEDMDYCIVENGIITNIIYCEDVSNLDISVSPWYEGARIGQRYDPTKIDLTIEEKIQAVVDRQEFLEDCIAEMAMVLYQ